MFQNSTWKQGIQTSIFLLQTQTLSNPQYSNWIPQTSATFKSYTLELSFNLVFQEPELQFWSIIQNNNTLFHQNIEVQKHIHKIKRKLFKKQPNFQKPRIPFPSNSLEYSQSGEFNDLVKVNLWNISIQKQRND